MQRQLTILAIGVMLLGSLLNACDNDVPVNAPYELNTVAYGLLEKSDSVHYIKVNKAFLNEGANARDIAGNRDSILHSSDIEVRLKEIVNQQVAKTYLLQRDTISGKEKGLFPNPKHVLYRTPKVDLQTNATYKLSITGLSNNDTVTAETSIVGDARLVEPGPSSGLPPGRTANFPVGFLDELTFNMQEGPNAHFYTMAVATVVTNVDTVTGERTKDTAYWEIFNQKTPNNNELETSKPNEAYFRVLGSAFSPEPDVVRPVDKAKVFIIVSGGNENLYTYLQVNEPSLGIVQKKPEFTNLSDGRGIFASRNRQSYEYKFSPPAKDSLRLHEFTRDLGFVKNF